MSDAREPHFPTNPLLLERARTMRHEPSRAEELLWQLLRGRRLGGFKFRRQVPLGCFIADFYCHELGLVVELDGETHDGRESEDAVCTQILERDGLHVLRFGNGDVLRNVRGVLGRIYEECKRRRELNSQDGASSAIRRRTPPHPGP